VSSGSFLLQWFGPCYAASETIAKEYLFSKTLLDRSLFFRVNPGRASAAKSFWNVTSCIWTAGIPMTFSVSLRDNFGNKIISQCDDREIIEISRVFSHVRAYY
jgi:hypothetical protein